MSSFIEPVFLLGGGALVNEDLLRLADVQVFGLVLREDRQHVTQLVLHRVARLDRVASYRENIVCTGIVTEQLSHVGRGAPLKEQHCTESVDNDNSK